MATYKIMLVEDDNNLRAIYGDRLLAEGYEIVAARDGEEALAMAVKEKPQLIISDVMMPKISGFDMLDILRTTPETKDVKVIMMTALSQAEDKLRADKLGADKYLVKSQVTLEDVARVVHEVLGDIPGEEPAPEATPAPVVPEVPAPAPLLTPAPSVDPMGMASASTPAVPVTEPVASPVATPDPAPVVASPAPEPLAVVPTSVPVAAPVLTVDPIATPVASTPAVPVTEPVASPVATPDPAPVVASPVAATPDTVTTTAGGQRVIQPINTVDPNAPPKIYELYEKEMAAETANEPVLNPPTGVVVEAAVAAPVPEVAPTQPSPAPQAPAGPPTPGQSFDPNSVAL